MTVSKRIKERREELQLTQEELAKRIGVQRPTLGRWELGGSISEKMYPKIAEAIGRSVEWVKYGDMGPSLAPEMVSEVSRAVALAYRAMLDRGIELSAEQMARLVAVITRQVSERGALSSSAVSDLVDLLTD